MSKKVWQRHFRYRMWLQIFLLELRKVFTYRVDFWVSFLGSIFVDLAIAYYLWSAIFTHNNATTIGGYSFESMMLYYLMVPLVLQTVVSHEMHFVADEIYSGSLNKYLLYPLSFFTYKLLAHLGYSFVAALRLLVGLGIFIWLFGIPEQLQTHITFTSLGLTLITCFFAAILYFVMAATMELAAFWADNVWSLMVILKFCGRLFGGALIPLTLFPDWARELLLRLPFSAYVSLPIEILFGTIGLQEWLMRMGYIGLWCTALMGCYLLVWARGKFRYTGVGI